MSLAQPTVLLVRALFVTVAVGCLGFAARDHVVGISTKEWLTTEGTVLESFVLRGGGVPETMDTLTAIVNYEYRVAGTRYVGSTVRIGDYLPWAPARVQNYPEGKQILVYYDPDKPQRAVLDRTYPLAAVVTFTVTAIFSLLCALYVKSIRAFLFEVFVPKGRKSTI